ncbi:MAG: hypothetical protein ACYC61_15295 [Isosphaeraceae bacterium]
MRFERWRGMPLVLTMAAVGLGLAWADRARADGYRLRHTIPGEVPAIDYSTGGEFMAPPVPYGHYAKEHVAGQLLGCAGCRLHGLLGCAGCGHEGGHGHGKGCGICGGRGCGFCGGGHGGAMGDPGPMACEPGCGGGRGHHHKAGRFAPCDSGTVVVSGPGAGFATTAGPSMQSMPTGQAVVMPSGQSPCGVNGCGIKGKHGHKGHNRLCGRCGGRGCGGCGGAGIVDGCGDPGCGLCGGGKGHGNGCGFCGGKGCSHCKGGLHSKLAGFLHLGPKVDYFVGPGGPVPITPGYVPYINVTRSPRDFFSFAPMNPYAP